MFPADMTAIEGDFKDGHTPVTFRKDVSDFRRVTHWQRKYNDKPSSHEMDVSSSYSFSQGAVAMFQVVFASVTLYRTRGDQIQGYGFVAFGLTVVPYFTMSIIDLISAFVTPNYPTFYTVKSETMYEAIAHGAKIEGMVGGALISVETEIKGALKGTFETEGDHRLYINLHGAVLHAQDQPELLEERLEIRFRFWHRRRRPTQEKAKLHQPSCSNVEGQTIRTTSQATCPFLRSSRAAWQLAACQSSSMLVCLVFRSGSTHTQRIWIMIGLVFGVALGPITTMADFAGSHSRNGKGDLANSYVLVYAIGIAVGYAATAIRGFVVVGEVIRQYETCI